MKTEEELTQEIRMLELELTIRHSGRGRHLVLTRPINAINVT